MNYPQHLLPQSNYKKIELCEDLGKCSLVRHTDVQDIFMEGTRAIDIDKIKFPSKQFENDLSTNLLSVFCIDDIFVQITNDDFIKDWKPEEAICSPIFEQDFILNTNRGHFALIIESILALNTTTPLIENGLTFEVLHTPSKCNFWHFSIRVYKDNILVGNLDVKNKQKEKLWRTARILISDLAYYVEKETHILSENHYIAN